MDIYHIFYLLGGLAMFLFGMNLMGSALEKSAGNRLKSILENLTSNPIKGFILGLGVTLIIQSSSATTVMVVGFVNSGVMSITQSMGIIFGSNLGASVTAWLLSLTGIEGEAWYLQIFKPTTFTPILAFVGIILYMFIDMNKANSKKKDLGLILLGFAVLMYGMEIMSSAVEPLGEDAGFQSLLIKFSNPILGVLVGTIFTAIIQSSGASVGILQALSLSVPISVATAVPVIMGQNIGTCITALISSIGASRNAKRVAIIHLSFNVIATLILLPIYYILVTIFQPAIVSSTVGPVGIAIIHTGFKIVALAIIMPFSKQLEKLSEIIVKEKKGDQKTQLLDERLLHTPSVAVECCKTVANEMATASINSFLNAIKLLDKYSEKEAEVIRQQESEVDKYEDSLGSYLVKLSSQPMTESDSAKASMILHIIGDFERISDHAVNIVESAEEMRDKKLELSPGARKELNVMINAVTEILNLSLDAFVNNNLENAYMIEALEEVVDYLRDKLKKHHVTRLQRSECTIEMGFILSDLLINFERVSDHCSNIGGSVLETSADARLDIHDYLKNLKSDENGEFKTNYEYYRMKYSL